MAFFKKDKSAVILEMAEGRLKLAESSFRQGSWVIEKLGSKEIAGQSDEELARSITLLFKELKVSSRRVIVALPRSQATIKSIKVPTHDAGELARMAEYQAARQVPFSIEEIVVSYRTVEKEKDGYTAILLVIVRRGLIERYINILASCGIHPRRICLNSEGLFNWYAASRPSFRDTEGKPLALLDIDESSAEIQIVFGGKMVFARSLSFKAEEGREVLLAQIKNSISAYYRMNKMNVPLLKIALTGAAARIKELGEGIKERLGIEAQEVKTFEHISVNQKLAGEIPALEKTSSFTSIAGIAVEPDAIEVDLVPKALVQAKKRESRKKDLVITIVLSLCLLGAAGLLIYKNVAEKINYLDELKGIISKTQPEAEEVEAMMKRSSAIKEQLRRGASSIDVLYELYDIMPEGVSISIFLFDEKGTLTLRGTAVQMSDVFNLIPLLEKSKYLRNVKVRYATKRKTRSGEQTDFEINCFIEKMKDKEGS